MPVPLFCCFCIPEKLYRKYSRNETKQKPKFLISRNEDGVRRTTPGEGPRHQATMGHGPGTTRAMGSSGGPGQPPTLLLRLYITFYPKNIGDGVIFHETSTEAPSPRKSNLGLLESCFGTLPERGIVTGGLFIAMIASTMMRE